MAEGEGSLRSAKGLFRFLGACYLLLIFYWMTRLWGHFPAFMDTLEYVFPEKWFNVESLRQGRIPLWNPNLASGTPHLANLQSAAFYPLFWIWNWTGLTDWFFVVALSHCFLALGGFYLWLRSQKASPLLSLLGGMSFAGSALLVNYWGFPTHLASIAWIPWVFWAADRFLKKPSFSSGFWAALFWALQILAGYPFFTFYGFCFLAVCVRWKFKADGRKKILYLSVFLAALAVTACQWLPFLDFLGSLHREGRGEFLFNLRWKNDGTLLSPSFLGTPGTTGYKGDYPDFIFDNLYLGIVPLGLFILNLWPSAQKTDFLLEGSGLVLVFLAGGNSFFSLAFNPGPLVGCSRTGEGFLPFCILRFHVLGGKHSRKGRKNLGEKSDLEGRLGLGGFLAFRPPVGSRENHPNRSGPLSKSPGGFVGRKSQELDGWRAAFEPETAK